MKCYPYTLYQEREDPQLLHSINRLPYSINWRFPVTIKFLQRQTPTPTEATIRTILKSTWRRERQKSHLQMYLEIYTTASISSPTTTTSHLHLQPLLVILSPLRKAESEREKREREKEKGRKRKRQDKPTVTTSSKCTATISSTPTVHIEAIHYTRR